MEFGSRNPRAARRWSWSGVPVRCCRRRPLCRSRRCSQVAWHLRAGAGGNDHLGVAPPEASAGSWFAPFVVRWSSITQPFRSAGCSVIARHRWCGLPSRAKKPESLRSAVFAAGRGGRIALGRPLHQSSAFGRCCRVWSNERMQLTARVLRFAPVSIRRLGLRSARAARLRNEPPVGVRLVHGGRQLMREPLCGLRHTRRDDRGRVAIGAQRSDGSSPPKSCAGRGSFEAALRAGECGGAKVCRLGTGNRFAQYRCVPSV